MTMVSPFPVLISRAIVELKLPLSQSNLSLYTITALLILDTDGQRVLVKYYAPPHQTAPGTGTAADLGAGDGAPGMTGLSSLKEQKGFEKSVSEKVRRGGGGSFGVHLATRNGARGHGGRREMNQGGGKQDPRVARSRVHVSF